MAVLNQSNKILKQGATDSRYQSTFLPIFQDAETRIKELVLVYFLMGKSKQLLIYAIIKIIEEVNGKIPTNLYDRDAYINGMKKRANYYVNQYYSVPMRKFERAKEQLIRTKPAEYELPNIKTPKEMLTYVKENKDKLWAEAKAKPYIVNYNQEVYKRMDEFAQMPMTTYEPGKKPISLWQKAELDVRYNKQMQMLQELKDKGVELAWTSSHVDCSKRCEKWQGKLMSLTEHATMSGFRVKKVDGHWVYSLTDIMDQVDKYGYHNNIICGFNCRHRLIQYDPKKSEPKEYTEKDVAKQRDIEEKIRRMERNIRLQKTRLLFYEQLGEKKIAKTIRDNVKILIERYKRYCERNGYAWDQYRINIREGSNKYL